MSPRFICHSVLALFVSSVCHAQTLYPALAAELKADGALLYNPKDVAVSGTYAFVASNGSNALEIIDITDPSHPKHLTSYSIIQPHCVVIVGNYAFVGSLSSLEVIDITHPTTPISKALLYFDNGDYSGVTSEFVSGNLLVVTGYNTLGVIDISVPENARFIGQLPSQSGTLLDNPSSVFVKGNLAYVTCLGNNALDIIDLSTPSNPVYKGSYRSAANSLNYPTDVAVFGTYALVTSYFGDALKVINVASPTSPSYAGQLNSVGTGAYLYHPRSIAVSGNLAYITSEGEHCVEIVDISTPTSPSHYSTIFNNNGGEAVLDQPYGISLSGNRLYVTDLTSQALEIIDVSNPQVPAHLGKIIQDEGGTNLLDAPQSLAVADNFAYIVGKGIGGLDIVDISNPNLPEHVSALPLYPPYSEKFITVEADLAFVAASGYLTIIEINDTSAPTVSAFIGTGITSVKGIFVSGQHLYIVGGPNRLEIYNVSDPTQPVLIGSATIAGLPSAVSVSGGYAFIPTYLNHSLEVLDISNPTLPNPVASLHDGGNVLLSYPSSITISGSYAYVTGNFSVEIVNITNPLQPVHAGSISNKDAQPLFASPGAVAIAGSTAYISSFGLDARDVSNPASPVFKGRYIGGTIQVPVSIVGNFAYQLGLNGLVVINLIAPAPPVALPPTNINADSFTAHWEAVAGATSYKLEVSSNNFQTLVSGYDPQNVSGTSSVVTSIDLGQLFEYRVRTVSANGISSYSNTITIDPLQITNVPDQLASLSVFPNPVDNELHIEGIDQPNTVLRVYGSRGELILASWQTNEDRITGHFGYLGPGLYILEILSGQTVKRVRFIKR